MSLIDALKQVRDYRTQPQYPLWVILLLVMMATMSGCVGYRAIESFVVRHQTQLLAVLEVSYKRLPCYSTIHRALVRVDFEALTQVFNQWAQETVELEEQAACAVDGKSIRVSLRDYDQAYQDFVSVVSVLSTRPGIVVGLQSMHNKTSSEIATVQTLLEHLQLQGVCFSFDALHAKKTVQQIIASQNHYLIAIKAIELRSAEGVQPKLLAQIQQQFEHSSPLSCQVDSERTRNRFTQRRVCVLEPSAIPCHDSVDAVATRK